MPRPVSVRIGAAIWLAPIALPLVSLFRNPAVSTPAELLAAALLALACARPALAIAAAAAVLPLGVTLGALLQLHFPFTEPMALAVAGGCCLRYLAKPRSLPAGAWPMLFWPALLALIVAASAAVECAAQTAFYASPAAAARQVWDILAFHYFLDVGRFAALRPAMAMIEGLALLSAAIVAVDTPRARTLALRAVLLGGTAVAAQNVLRLCEIALRGGEGFWTAIARQLVTARISAAFADVNAAGSYLVMALVTAIVWWWRRRGIGTAAIIPLLVLGLWISGSRTAQAAGALALAAVIAPRRGRWWVAGALVLASVVALFAAQRFRTTTDPASALFVRVELLKAGARMLRAEPVFGVGIGRFYESSERFISPELAHFYVRENAHNQFLQVAGELGLVGLLVFLVVLVQVLRRVVRDRARPDPLRDALAGGLLAFLLSAVGGHPLLVAEVAFAFWIVAGLAWTAGSAAAEGPASQTEAPPGVAGSAGTEGRAPDAEAPARTRADGASVLHRTAIGPGALVLAMAVLLLSMPWRVDRAVADLPLEHVGIDLSPWQRDAEGHRYRVMHGHAAIYVPAHARPSRFLARIGRGGPPALRLALSIDRRLVNEVTLSHEWREVTIVVPRSGRSAYQRLDLAAASPAGGQPHAEVHIGIVEAGP